MRCPPRPVPAVALALLPLLLTAGAAAQDAAAPKDAGAVSRFFDEQTLAVVRINLDKVNAAAAGKWLAGGGGAPLAADVVRAQATVDAAVRDLKKAGAKQAFVVVSLADEADGGVPGFFVVPLPAGGDADAIGNVLTTGRAARAGAQAGQPQLTSATIDGAVVAGKPATIERLRALQPAPREDVTKILAGEAGDSAVVAAICPTDDMRKVLEQMVPELPAPIGGGSMTTVTRGARWTRVVVDLPPDAAMSVTFQAQDAAAAKAMGGLLERALKAAANAPELRDAAGKDVMDRLVQSARPKIDGDRVTLSLDRRGANDLAPPLLAAAGAARRKAALSQSANNMRQLLIGCVMYADANKGQFPESLEQAAKTAAGGDEKAAAALLRNPRGAARYEYVKPAGLEGEVAQTLVIYEKTEKWDGPAVLGFADGHVTMVGSEAELRKQVEAAKEAAKKPL